jgi:hypothetical protein
VKWLARVSEERVSDCYNAVLVLTFRLCPPRLCKKIDSEATPFTFQPFWASLVITEQIGPFESAVFKHLKQT